MASLRRLENSPYWIACFALPDGRRTQRTTGVLADGVKAADPKPILKALQKRFGAKIEIEGESGTMTAREAKEFAQKIADHYEQASRLGRANDLTQSKTQTVLSDICKMATGDALQSSTIADYLTAWLLRKKIESGQKTHARYTSVVTQFVSYLGPRSNRQLSQLEAKEIVGFRDALARRVTPGTVNVSLKILRSALSQARKDGLIEKNEAERVSLLKRLGQFERRPFTMGELRRVLEVADDEWKGMIMVGLYTGQRLGDVADLRWSNVDLQRLEIRLTTDKTGRRQIIPIAKALARFFETTPAGDDPNAPLFRRASGIRARSNYSGTLSSQFFQILVAAGLAKERSHKSTGKGRSAKRTQNELGFHCLRHTATSLLKNAGVSEAVAMEFVGHDSTSVSRQYTHIEQDSLRRAADLMPDIAP